MALHAGTLTIEDGHIERTLDLSESGAQDLRARDARGA